MSYIDRDPLGMYRTSSADSLSNTSTTDSGPGPRLMGADTLIGDDVYNHSEEDLGDIKEIMLDMRSGEVAYAVLSFGGVLGMGEKLFAVPWQSLTLDTVNKRFLLDIDKEQLKNAPGFDKDSWPDMANDDWKNDINAFYGSASRSNRSGLGGVSDSGGTIAG